MKKFLVLIILLISTDIYAQRVIGLKLTDTSLGQENIVFIEDIIVNSDAIDAGIMIGDWIVAIEGQSVSNLNWRQVNEKIKAGAEINESVKFTVNRNGVIKDIQVKHKDYKQMKKEWIMEGQIWENDGVFISPSFAIDTSGPQVDTNFHTASIHADKGLLLITDKIKDNLSKNIKGSLTITSGAQTNQHIPFNIVRNGPYNNIILRAVSPDRFSFFYPGLILKVSLPGIKSSDSFILHYRLEDNAGNKSYFVKNTADSGFKIMEGKFHNPEPQEKKAEVKKETLKINLYGQEIETFKNTFYTNDRGDYIAFQPAQKLAFRKEGIYYFRIAPGKSLRLDQYGKIREFTAESGYFGKFSIKPNSTVRIYTNGMVDMFYNMKLIPYKGNIIQQGSYIGVHENGEISAFTLGVSSRINGGFFEEGDRVYLSSNNIITSVGGDEGSRKVGPYTIEFPYYRSDKFVAFYPDGSIQQAHMKEPFKYKGLTLGGFTSFYKNGNLKESYVLKVDKDYKYPIKANSSIYMYENGQLSSCVFDKAILINGIKVSNQTSFNKDGSFRSTQIVEPWNYKGIILLGYVNFNEKGNVDAAVVFGVSKKYPLKIAEKSQVYFYETGKIKECQLDKPSQYQGMTIGKYCRFYDNGKLHYSYVYNSVKPFKLPVKLTNQISFHENGSLSTFKPLTNFTYQRLPVSQYGEVTIFQNGKLAQCYLSSNITIQGYPAASQEITFSSNGGLMSFTPYQPFKSAGYTFMANKKTYLHENGIVNQGTLNESGIQYGGIDIPSGSQLQLYPSGKIKVFSFKDSKALYLEKYKQEVPCYYSLSFHENGAIKSIYTREEVKLGGKAYKGTIYFDEEGWRVDRID